MTLLPRQQRGGGVRTTLRHLPQDPRRPARQTPKLAAPNRPSELSPTIVEQSNQALTGGHHDEDVFNSSLRGFLKKVGITSQREIESRPATRSPAAAQGPMKNLPAKIR